MIETVITGFFSIGQVCLEYCKGDGNNADLQIVEKDMVIRAIITNLAKSGKRKVNEAYASKGTDKDLIDCSVRRKNYL